jgi:cold shock CspA family protein
MTGGIVKLFSGQTGYGFATADENGEHLFVHRTVVTGACQSSLAGVR